MSTDEALDRGRQALEQFAWGDAFVLLTRADRDATLEPEDLERLATAAHLIGRHAECEATWTRAYHEWIAHGRAARAVHCAFRMGFELMLRGESARGSGWFARGRRLLEECGDDCAERGYLLLPVAMQHIGAQENEAAYTAFDQAAAIGTRFGDTDLIAWAHHGRGRALIRMGRVADGIALLDEVMVGVTAGEVSPIFAGDIYCSVIEACHEIFDMRRAAEWTAALSRWCESQPDLVPYRGQCLIRRAEIMRLSGAWPEAMEEALRASEHLTRPPGQSAAGAAFYQQAELHRLRAEFAQAEEAYRRASEWGYRPEPGLAQLCLAQGQVDAAAAAIRRALDEARDQLARSRLLAACVEIMLATGDVRTAEEAANELTAIATAIEAPLLRVHASRSVGAVYLAQGEARAALDALHRAWSACQELEAPHETACVRVLTAVACRELGDDVTAELELDAARQTFRQLGAALDLARVDALVDDPQTRPRNGLTPREIEVLRLVAAGMTNRAVAAKLFISEKTVARHLSNIFTKLGLSTRSAATAYAYEHNLL